MSLGKVEFGIVGMDLDMDEGLGCFLLRVSFFLSVLVGTGALS